MEGVFEYKGNIHIHSDYSDGGAGIESIADYSMKAGLSFICINDHDYMVHSLHTDEEGFYNDILVLIGLEIGRRYNHYLAYNINKIVRYNGLGAQEIIDEVNNQGGFGFIAHPFEKGMPFFEKSIAYTWNDHNVDGYTGICIWNFMSRWKERVKTPVHGILLLLFKSMLLKGPSNETLRCWDMACLKRRTVAIGGSDAHGTRFKIGGVSFLPFNYKFLLNSINIHILLKERLSRRFKDAKEQVYDAMKQGRLFIAHDRLRPSEGFEFYYVSQRGKILFMGEEDNFEPGELFVKLPAHGMVRIIKNGRLWNLGFWKNRVLRVNEKGVYRVEVYKHVPIFGWRAWIFSNPVFLR